MCRAPTLPQCSQVWVRLFGAQALFPRRQAVHSSDTPQMAVQCVQVLLGRAHLPLATGLRRLHVSPVPSPFHWFSAQTTLGNCLPGLCTCRLSPHRNVGS